MKEREDEKKDTLNKDQNDSDKAGEEKEPKSDGEDVEDKKSADEDEKSE